VGELDLKVNKIRDKKSREIFKPVLDVLDVTPFKNIQDDISWASADIATKNSYRDTEYIMENYLKATLSPVTINRRVIEAGKEIKEFMKNKNKNNNDNDNGHDYDYDYFLI
jgi:hypothetical protein